MEPTDKIGKQKFSNIENAPEISYYKVVSSPKISHLVDYAKISYCRIEPKFYGSLFGVKIYSSKPETIFLMEDVDG